MLRSTRSQLSVKPSANVSCQLNFRLFVSYPLTPSRPSLQDKVFHMEILIKQDACHHFCIWGGGGRGKGVGGGRIYRFAYLVLPIPAPFLGGSRLCVFFLLRKIAQCCEIYFLFPLAPAPLDTRLPLTPLPSPVDFPPPLLPGSPLPAPLH